MYKIYKRVLESKSYNLADITDKIEQRCAEGQITEAERAELLTLANQNASAENSKAAMQNQIDALFEICAELALEIKTLKEGTDETPEEAPDVQEEYPQWQRWNGIDKIPYQTDSKVTHNGVKYISMVDNNFWEPGAPGVYDNIWKKVETE